MARDSHPPARGRGRHAPRPHTFPRRRGAAIAGPAVIAAAGLLAACGAAGGAAGQPGGGGSRNSAGAAGRVIMARQLGGLGTVLVNRAGKTIYSPEQEARGKIRCTSACLGFWFPVTVSSASIPPHTGGIGGVLGTIRRPDDGRIQLTYDRKPLYTFRLDTSPGQDHGNDFSDSFGGTSFTWRAVTTTSRAAASAGPAGATPGGGSPYQGAGSGY